MIFKNLSIAISLAATTYTTIVSAQGNYNTRATTVRAVRPWDDIAAAIESDAVDAKATYTISASHLDFGQDAILPPDMEASIEETTFTFEVSVATPAVTADTLILDENGNLARMGELSYSLLVPSAADREAGTMALISVDHKTGEANGIVQKSKAATMHIRQKKGQSIVAEEEAEFEPPAWECTAADEHEEEPLRHRHLEEDGHHHDHHHDHSHHHHDHDHGIDGNDLPGSFENLRKSLRGADVSKIGKRRKLEDSSLPYLYQIDMYIEIDNVFVENNGGSVEKAYNYVNTLVTGANVIYEHEIGTHLNVYQIELTSRYKNIKTASDGLAIMKKNWAGNKWSNSKVDLHHALIGKRVGGGVAYVGVVCNTNFGFGVSGSVSGSFKNMDSPVMWDFMVFTHEVGHNLNSGHTFSGYDPPVDKCYLNGKCVSIEDSSATLMSYCHACGGFKKVEYTFGGEYDGSGNRGQLSNWIRSGKLKSNASVNSQRVPHKMYQHVASRGTCVAVPATPKPTPSPTSKPPPPPPPSPSNPSTYRAADGCLKTGEKQTNICLASEHTSNVPVNCCSGSMENKNLQCSRGNGETRSTFAEAKNVCEKKGMRLCSVAELETGKCCGKGFGYDWKISWTSDTCETDRSDGKSTSKPTPQPTTPSSNPSTYRAADGCLKSGEKQVDMCLASEQTSNVPVNCCSGSMESKNLQCSRKNCETRSTFAAAKTVCEKKGMRLCTVAELETGKCCGKGCLWDKRNSWTSDTCETKLTDGKTIDGDGNTAAPTNSTTLLPTYSPTSSPINSPTSSPTNSPEGKKKKGGKKEEKLTEKTEKQKEKRKVKNRGD